MFVLYQDSFENEKWLPIKGFEERFLISNYGRILSINGRRKGINLMQFKSPDSTGYLVTQLRKVDESGNWIYLRQRIHVLVAEHFLVKPNIPNVCVNHLDRNRLNNHVSNLEWTDLASNVKHAKDNGSFLVMTGSRHFMSKLNEEQVLECRRRYKAGGVSHQQLASEYGISRRNMGDVINGVTWSWLK